MVLAAAQFRPVTHTLLFVLSILAIVPRAVLLSHATGAVAARTGDAVGGLLNATLGNLTELVIALTALGAGQYMLVKASIAGAIVTNTLFMLGASFLLGGLKYHTQEFNRVAARFQAGLLFLATIALLVPSALIQVESGAHSTFTQDLSLGLAVLLIACYGMGMLYSLKTHKEMFASVVSGESHEASWPIGLALATLAGVTVLVALVSEVFFESVQKAAETFGMSPAFVGFIVVALVGAAAEMASAFSGARKNRLDLSVGIALGSPDSALCRTGAGAGELLHRADADGPAVLAGGRDHGIDRHHDRCASHQQRALNVVSWHAGADGLPDLCHDAVSVAPKGLMRLPESPTYAQCPGRRPLPVHRGVTRLWHG